MLAPVDLRWCKIYTELWMTSYFEGPLETALQKLWKHDMSEEALCIALASDALAA